MASYQVLINDAIKKYLLAVDSPRRNQLRKAFEFLESGLWEGGLRIKKLQGVGKTILEGRLNRGDRLLFTLGESPNGSSENHRLIHIWGVVDHDELDRKARSIVPDNAPFLNFQSPSLQEVADVDLDEMDSDHLSQFDVHDPASLDSGHQRWFVLNEREWRRLLLYQQGDFEISLYLTPEQRRLLEDRPPLLLSGTAGSGKSTLAIYYLLRPQLDGKSRLFLTYNPHLRNFSERLYRGLMALTETQDTRPPKFLTFVDLCRQLIPAAETRFPKGRQMTIADFEAILRHYPQAARYDTALVWEEVRSIIKGSKPSIDTDRIRALTTQLEGNDRITETLFELREELLAIRNLSVFDRVEGALKRVLGLGLRDLVVQLEELRLQRPAQLNRGLQVIQKELKKREASFETPLMTLSEYEKLGQKRAPNFLHDRKQLHGIALRYQEELVSQRRWDEIDLTRAALRFLEKHPEKQPRYDFVACDEVQDFTDLQLSLVFRLGKDPRSLLLAGDPKQIINPSGFRWEEVRQLFYDRHLDVPSVRHLTLNFRCVGSIVRLGNALIGLKQALLGVRRHEKLDDWKFQGRPPCLLEAISEDVLLQETAVSGADRIILTRTEELRDQLKERLDTELVLTIWEAKGLEFTTVLLWGFGSDQQTRALWKKMLAQETAGIHEALIRHEINLLYVGVTRARQNLIVYDGPRPSTIWEAEQLRGKVFRTDELEYLSQAWKPLSSRQEWEEQGIYYLEREHYGPAAECFRNADRPELMNRAQALASERKNEWGKAAAHWLKCDEFDRAALSFRRDSQFEEAIELWLQLDDSAQVEECRLEMWEKQARYEELAAYWQTKDDDKAIRYWKQAGRYEEVGRLLEQQKRFRSAAEAYQRAQQFERAAGLYAASESWEEAAGCYESSQNWEEAWKIWRRLKKSADIERCLLKLGDVLRLAQHYEGRKDWHSALDAYAKAWSPALQLQFENEVAKKGRGGPSAAGRALRYMLLKKPLEAAIHWEKAKLYDFAGPLYQSTGHFVEAARCFEKAGLFVEAVKLYGQAEKGRTALLGIRRCATKLDKMTTTPVQEREFRVMFEGLAEQERFDMASAVAECGGYRWDAAILAVLAGDVEKGLRCPQRLCDYSAIVEKVIQFGRFAEGAEFFQKRVARSSFDLSYEIFGCFQHLIDVWLHRDPDEAERRLIDRYLREFAVSFEADFVIANLQDRGYSDDVYKAGLQDFQSWNYEWTYQKEPNRGTLLKEASRMEAEGRLAPAGIRYLWIDEMEAARRCWGQVEATDYNLQCLEEAGFLEKVVVYLAAKGRFIEAAGRALSGGELPQALEWIEKSNRPKKGADLLYTQGYYREALDYYLRCDHMLGAARCLEKLKRFDEAAKLWERLGDLKRLKKCRERLHKQIRRNRIQRLF